MPMYLYVLYLLKVLCPVYSYRLSPFSFPTFIPNHLMNVMMYCRCISIKQNAYNPLREIPVLKYMTNKTQA